MQYILAKMTELQNLKINSGSVLDIMHKNKSTINTETELGRTKRKQKQDPENGAYIPKGDDVDCVVDAYASDVVLAIKKVTM